MWEKSHSFNPWWNAAKDMLFIYALQRQPFSCPEVSEMGKTWGKEEPIMGTAGNGKRGNKIKKN